MAAPRPSVAPQDFSSFVFSYEYFTVPLCLETYNKLLSDSSQISDILTDDDILFKLLSDFEVYMKRIARFFTIVKDHSTDVARLHQSTMAERVLRKTIVEQFLLPLFGDDFKKFHSQPAFIDLIASIIQFNLSFYPGALKPLADCLGKKSELLKLLTSGEDNSSVMKDWIVTFRGNITNYNIFESWTSIFITLCENCERDHGTSWEIQRWHKLRSLRERLKSAQEQLRNNTKCEKSSHNVPLSMMRKLGDDDKKSTSGKLTEVPTANINFSATDLTLLRSFNIAPPSSERGLILALEKLEKDETLSIMQNLVDTFPCRLCNECRESHTAKDNSFLYTETDQPQQFSKLFGRRLGIWRVHLSEQALKDFQKSSYEGKFEYIKKKLIQLASGDWKRKSLVHSAGNSNQRQRAHGTLHKAVYGSNGRILWQVDVEFDEDTNDVTQVVKVWRIGDVKEMKKAINSALHVQKNYPESRTKACRQTLIDKHGRNIPITFSDKSVLKLEQKARVGYEEVDPEDGKSFSNSEEGQFSDNAEEEKPFPDSEDGQSSPDAGEEKPFPNPDEEESLSNAEDEKSFESTLLSNKFYALTETVVDNLNSKNLNVEFPLILSEEELRIINAFKTSTLVLGRSGTGKTTCLVYKLVSRYFGRSEIQKRKPPSQILLTRSPVLAYKLGRQTKRLIDTRRGDITDKVEDDLWAGIDGYDKEIMDTITSLKGDDFPLVCTFDHFLKLLENTIRYADRKDFSAWKGCSPIGKNDHRMPDLNEYGRKLSSRFHSRKSQNVDFQIFKDEYWCTFPHHLTYKLPESSAFMEIMGVIKGSASAETQFKPLSREEYQAKSFRVAPTFHSMGERDRLYDIYEIYEKQKLKRQAHDSIDRVISIFRAISENENLKAMVEKALDEIYVDEVQDQRLLEITLLVNLIKDPRGIHFAGDTAQCISKDSTFRFEDVKALLFRNFSRLSTITNAPGLARPELIKLDKNFRAHQGILSFASFVMNLLWREFPAMVDKLPPEIGQYLGPKPTLLVNFGSFFTSVLQSVELRPRAFDFGAEQVIIVRDKEDKERLRDDIGRNRKVLILTILESKGMEFDDVFLVDFFTTSECRSQFRALARSGNTDGLKHMALCTELKQLYVAITRPRSRLWLFESDPSSITSIVELLMKEPGQPLVDIVFVKDTGTDENVKWIVQQICHGKTSKPQEWSTKGREFLHRQDYENAKFCFENAKDGRGVNIAQAFIEEQKGRVHRALGKWTEFVNCFREAASLFHESKLPFKEATCYEDLGEFKKAAEIFSAQGEYEKAASLFELAKCYEEASNSYIDAGNYEEGAGALRRGGLFDKLVYYLNKHRDSIDSNTQSHFSRLCNLLLKQGKISSNLEAMTVEALGSDSEKESFYRDFGMTDKLMEFYMAKKKYLEIFDLAVKNGDMENAWSFVEDYDLHGKIPRAQLIDIFNYVQAGSLGAWRSLESTPTRNENWNPRNSLVSEISPAKRSWQQLALILNDCQRRAVDCESIRLEESWMKQFFSIIVTIKVKNFIDTTNKMSELPIEFVNEVTNMVKLLDIEEKIAPSLLLFLGIFPVPKKAETYRLLDWSPLNSSLNLSTKNFDTPAIVDKTRKWVLDYLHPAITQIHDKALSLHKKEHPRTCHFYLTTMNCRKRQTEGCEYSHRLITQEEFANIIRDFLRMCSLYNTFNLLYSRYKRQPDVLNDEFAESFAGHRRVWFERLIAQITFFSSFEHDAAILTKIHRDISCESSKFFGALGELENHLFYRIRERKEQRHNFSYLLELLQHSETLGVADRFMKCLTRAFWDAPWYPSKIHARRILNDIRNLRYEKVPGSSETHERYKTLFWTLEQFPIDDFPSFHAVISLYEKLATFLIYMIRPTEFLIPNSWVQMYLLQMPGLFTKEGQVQQSGSSSVRIQQVKSQENSFDVSQYWYQQSLLRAVESFCVLLRNFLDHDGAVTTVSAGNRYPKPRQYLARRQIDFLAVTMANLWSMLQQPRDITRVWNIVQTIVTRLPINVGDWGRLPPQMLTTKLFEMFKHYNKKDFLLIVTRAGKTSHVFFGLHVQGVSTVSMDSIWSTRVHRATASVPASNAESQLNSDYTEKEEKAAEIIQNFWRMRYPKVRQRQEFLASPIGKTHVFIQTLREKITRKCLCRTERLERTILLVRDGAKLYLRVKSLEDRFREIRNISKEKLEDDALTADQLESLQILWEELPKIRRTVRKEVTIYTKKDEEWLDWSPGELRRKYAKTKAFLDDVEAELNKRTEELEEICSA